MKYQNEKRFFALGALLGAVVAAGGGAQASNLSCPTCALQARMTAQKPLTVAVSDMNSSNIDLGFNVAGLLSRPQALAFPQAALPAGTTSQTAFWNGQGDLPNAFVRPWELPKTNFDPSMITEYYTTQKGPINIENAPWNLFLPPSIAQAYYAMAMTMMGGPISPVAESGVLPPVIGI